MPFLPMSGFLYIIVQVLLLAAILVLWYFNGGGI